MVRVCQSRQRKLKTKLVFESVGTKIPEIMWRWKTWQWYMYVSPGIDKAIVCINELAKHSLHTRPNIQHSQELTRLGCLGSLHTLHLLLSWHYTSCVQYQAMVIIHTSVWPLTNRLCVETPHLCFHQHDLPKLSFPEVPHEDQVTPRIVPVLQEMCTPSNKHLVQTMNTVCVSMQ